MLLFPSQAKGEWTCTVARWTGTLEAPEAIALPALPPTNKQINIDICTFAHWRNGEITRLKVFFDSPAVLQQLGLA